MSTQDFGTIEKNASLSQVIEAVADLQDNLNFLLNGFLSSDNAREFGGWRIGKTELQSSDKKVGMSTSAVGVDPIRFWAGDVVTGSPSFSVSQSGKMKATNGQFTGTITGSVITGGTVQSGTTGTDRIELSGGKFRGITAAGSVTGLYFDIGAVAGTGIADIFLYHNGTKLLEFYDDITKFTIKGSSGATGMTLGGSSAPTFAAGSWSFNGGSSLNLSSATVTGLSTDSSGYHDHGIDFGVTLATTSDGSSVDGYVTWVPSGSHSHNVI